MLRQASQLSHPGILRGFLGDVTEAANSRIHTTAISVVAIPAPNRLGPKNSSAWEETTRASMAYVPICRAKFAADIRCRRLAWESALARRRDIESTSPKASQCPKGKTSHGGAKQPGSSCVKSPGRAHPTARLWQYPAPRAVHEACLRICRAAAPLSGCPWRSQMVNTMICMG
jgi:hypothetical protein